MIYNQPNCNSWPDTNFNFRFTFPSVLISEQDINTRVFCYWIILIFYRQSSMAHGPKFILQFTFSLQLSKMNCKIVYKISTFPCTWSGLENSFFQYILHRIGSQQMKIYVNFSFWTIEAIRGRPRPLWRPHFDCDLKWPPYIALLVLFPNNSKFF